MDNVIQPGSGLCICVLGALIQFFSVSEEGKLLSSTCMQLTTKYHVAFRNGVE